MSGSAGNGGSGARDGAGGSPVGGAGGSAGANPSACDPPPGGLVGRWPGDGTANDVIGGDDGSFSGTYAPGQISQSFVIDKTRYVTVPNESALNSAALSVEVWFRHDTATATYDPVVKKQDNQIKGFALEFDSSGSNLIFWVYTAANGWRSTGAHPISTGVWTHAVGSYDGSTINLYANGSLATTGSASGPIVLPSSSSLMIGHDPGNVTSRSFVGLIDEVSIYNRAPSLREVQSIYAAGNTGNCP